MRNTFFVPVKTSEAGTLALRIGVEHVRIDASAAGGRGAGAPPEHAERHQERLAPVRIRPRPAGLGRHAA